MWALLPLLGVPLLIMLVAKSVNNKSFTALEFLALEGGMVLLLVFGFSMARCNAIADTEVWSGRITDKLHGSQHCCHCRTVCDTCTRRNSDGRTETYRCNCRQVCDHSRDYWWALQVSTGDKISVDRCEPRKSRVPQAWIDAYIGEPAVVAHSYQNYLKADPESVLIQSAEFPDFKSPTYPKIYNLYKIKRAINLGTLMPRDKWNAGLMDLNADLGGKKQVNIVVIATKETDPHYAEFVEHEWLYGKKNDLIFVLGAPDGNTIEWARIVTISNVEMLKIRARDEMPGMKLTDAGETLGYIRALVEEDFTRTPMAEYEYLASAAKPTPFALGFLYFLAIVGSVVGSIFMIYNDVFREEVRSYYNRYRRW